MAAKNDTKVIQWENPGQDDMVWRYPSSDIRFGAALVVREWEGAAFLRDGKLFDIFGPGRHILTTQNLPLLTKAYSLLMGYKETPFKADVVFFSKKMFNGRWGVRTQVKVAADFQAPIPLMANGDYQFRLDDPTLFITQVLGGQRGYSTGATNEFLRGFLNEKLMQELSAYTYMEVYGNLEATSRKTQVNVAEALAQRGIKILALRIVGVDTEESYKQDIYQYQRFRSNAGREYRQMEVMEKMADAIGTSGGAGVGTGMLLFPQMYQQMSQPVQQSGQAQQKILCPYCAQPNEYPYKFCSNCGKPPVMEKKDVPGPAPSSAEAKGEGAAAAFSICPYCGKDLNLPKTPRFCPYCKERLV
jgi:membrane protease subunit (stomatin/prohibitin family)